jgi:hypothetical protein
MANRVASEALLLSHYKTNRLSEGDLVIMMPWPTRTLLGCAGPTAVVAIVAAFVAQVRNEPGWYGMSVMTCLFAVIVIPIVIYKSSHAWVLSRGFIKPATTLAGRYWSASAPLGAQSVVLKRELWPGERGSTDQIFVLTDGSSPLKLVSVFNWSEHESRLASGGTGSLARSGPRVPDAPAPLLAIADSNLKSAVSESIRELAELAVHELGVPMAFACAYARQSPDDVD